MVEHLSTPSASTTRTDLYAYLHAVAVLLPCPRGLEDFDQACPDEDPKSFNSKIKAQLQAAHGQGARSRGVAEVLGQVASVPMQVVGGTVGLVQQGLRSLAAVGKPSAGGVDGSVQRPE